MRSKFPRSPQQMGLPNERGSLMIPLLVISGVVIVIAAMIGNMLVQLMKVNSALNLQVTASLVKERILNTIQNDSAWAQTVATEASLACLRNNGQFCPGAGGAFTLRDADGRPVVAFDENGEPCSSNCLFAYTYRWRPNCPAGCPSEKIPGDPFAFKPYIVLDASLVVNPDVWQRFSRGGTVELNTERYSVANLERGRSGDTLSSVCRALGGRFDQVTETCQLAPSLVLGPCGPSEVMKGIDANGNRICEPMPSLGKECSNSAAVLGVTPDGDILCGKF